MLDKQFKTIIDSIEDVKTSSCGVITSIMVLIILLHSCSAPDKDDIKDIVHKELIGYK